MERVTNNLVFISLISGDDSSHYREFNGEEIVKTKHEEGLDHPASLEPEKLKAMVTAIRNIEKAMGDGEKKPSSSETKNISVARKSIVAKMSIKKGELFTEKNLTVKRPGNGISPMEWNAVIGSKANIDYKIDQIIKGEI